MMQVTFTGVLSPRSSVWITRSPISVMGTLMTTCFGCHFTYSRASASISASVSVVSSTLVGTLPMEMISRMCVLRSTPGFSFEMISGFVVIPETMPVAMNWRISLRSLESRKMATAPSDGWEPRPYPEYSPGVSICQIHDHRLCLDNLTGPPRQKGAHRHTGADEQADARKPERRRPPWRPELEPDRMVSCFQDEPPEQVVGPEDRLLDSVDERAPSFDMGVGHHQHGRAGHRSLEREIVQAVSDVGHPLWHRLASAPWPTQRRPPVLLEFVCDHRERRGRVERSQPVERSLGRSFDVRLLDGEDSLPRVLVLDDDAAAHLGVGVRDAVARDVVLDAVGKRDQVPDVEQVQDAVRDSKPFAMGRRVQEPSVPQVLLQVSPDEGHVLRRDQGIAKTDVVETERGRHVRVQPVAQPHDPERLAYALLLLEPGNERGRGGWIAAVRQLVPVCAQLGQQHGSEQRKAQCTDRRLRGAVCG